jgi:hypothetical protein
MYKLNVLRTSNKLVCSYFTWVRHNFYKIKMRFAKNLLSTGSGLIDFSLMILHILFSL